MPPTRLCRHFGRGRPGRVRRSPGSPASVDLKETRTPGRCSNECRGIVYELVERRDSNDPRPNACLTTYLHFGALGSPISCAVATVCGSPFGRFDVLQVDILIRRVSEKPTRALVD